MFEIISLDKENDPTSRLNSNIPANFGEITRERFRGTIECDRESSKIKPVCVSLVGSIVTCVLISAPSLPPIII